MVDIQIYGNTSGVSAEYTRTLSGATHSEVIHLLELSYIFLSSQKEAIIAEQGRDCYEYCIGNAVRISKVPLSFEDFHEFPHVRLNFNGFFIPNYIGDVYRAQPYYKKFTQDHGDLYRALLEIFGEEQYTTKNRPLDALLYEAYRAMLSDPEVGSNKDLFT